MKDKLLIALILVSIAITAGILVSIASKADASVAVSNEYLATTTDTTWTTATAQCKDTLTGRKTLGSIVVDLTSNADIFVYDATTTGPHTDHATTTIVAKSVTNVGTYTYDVTVTRGLCVVVTNATNEGIASSTITTRP